MSSQIFEQVIGLEIHAQLLTKTKLFCGCSTSFGKSPNSLTCPVCLGLPGALPVFNKEAMVMAVKLALAIKARIHRHSVFSRKNYFYPDLPKGYQITQYHFPIATEGQLTIEGDGKAKTVGIDRINLEEDAGKSIHDGMADSSEKTYLDFNRSGIPLVEIVGKPDMNSSSEAVDFLQLFRTILQYLEICDGNMEEGNLRCDANLSLRQKGSQKLGVKVEIKNLNSFRFLQKALDYEFQRQTELVTAGKPVLQETRLWDSKRDKTLAMRSKEEAHDYRYFPEPDLPPLVISEELINESKDALPELPQEKIERFLKEYGIPLYEAKVLTSSRKLSDYFEKTAKASGNPDQSSKWILREVLQYLKENKIEIADFPLSPENLAELIIKVDKKEITLRAAKEEVFPEMLKRAIAPEIKIRVHDKVDVRGYVKVDVSSIVKEKGLSQISDEGRIKEIILQIIEKNPKPFKQYSEGKVQVLGFFVGEVMRETKGSANPELVNKLLKEILESYKK
jgi:aspartyl-tRNA(Asn)/glutamyl-tRNA(Gln) amidotransferase subunit B